MRLPNFGSPNFFTFHYSLFTIHFSLFKVQSSKFKVSVLSQVATTGVAVTALVLGSIVVPVVVTRTAVARVRRTTVARLTGRCALGSRNLSLGLVGPCQLHILLQLVTSGFFPALFFMFILKN